MFSKIYIRADGSNEIGLGHLIRCMALGHMLRSHFQVHYACKEVPVTIKMDIIQEGFLFQAIDTEEEFLRLLTGKEIVVLDHYDLDINYHKKVKERGSKLVCIDDLYDKDFFADLIINHSPGVTYYNYRTPAITQFALGPEFALLRPPFLSYAKREARSKSKESVLICFGGSDFKNLTVQTLAAVLEFEEIKKIVVVTGAAYRHQKELDILGSTSERVWIYDNVNAAKMAELISQSDIAVVPSSGVLMEALAVGNHIVAGMYVENQKLLYEHYKNVDAIYSAGDFSPGNLKRALRECLSSAQVKADVIDGNSGKRILKIFTQLETEESIRLRSAEASDLSLTYRWATDKSVRAFSFNQSGITLEGHTQWFASKLEDNRCLYFIAELDNRAIGSLRFDMEGEEAIISYLIDPNFHKRGLGVPLLKTCLEAFLKEERKEIKKIIGYVMPENIASSKTFERFGFEKTAEGHHYKYTLQIN